MMSWSGSQAKYGSGKAKGPRVVDLDAGRRVFLKTSGLAAASAAVFGTAASGSAQAQTATPPSDVQILNFALNLEYLEGEYYTRATTGQGLDSSLTTGQGTPGDVIGGSQVTFNNPLLASYAQEIASDEQSHIRFLRTTLGSAAVARPKLNLRGAFTKAALAAGVIAQGETFDPYASEANFLLGAYLLTDVGVTAYHGSAALITSKTILTQASGILVVEAYHAGLIHTSLFNIQAQDPSQMIFRKTHLISAHRSDLSRLTTDALPNDQGLSPNDSTLDGGPRTPANIVPTDANAIAFPRTQRQVLNIVYGVPESTEGLFFPNGINFGPAS